MNASKLPNPLPRPPGELEALAAAWQPPARWRIVSAVNNTYIGLFYVGTAFLFFLLAGVLALLMRTQLVVAENEFLTQARYNQVFTMHGTVMMFLFAVPAVEAMAVYLLPGMLAARDLPFPRLSAYAFWAYFVGGLAFFASLFFDLAPDGGWFMYPPLTSWRYSPGHNSDFWLLGIGFIEISAIAGAIEIIVGVLRTRAPGMSLAALPVYAWAMLVFAVLIVVAFPAVILATAMLEIERSFRWPFFDAELGGDPLLWQHLFWFFGHPEVYIIFLPAAGFVSMILPAMTGVPLVAYRLVVLALVATGITALGVWVHHMFTTGIPATSTGFFSAASMVVAVPSGIQVFAWIATLAAGRLRLTVPALFVLGFLFIFTVGGLTGVMVAIVPFDWQVHDTYFVVAHLHYVLIGGMVFPLFGAFYYWAPTASARRLSDRLGRWVFGLMFVGFNLTFFPMHLTGLLGMPRRVWTYPVEMGWEPLNMLSTAGAYLLGASVLLFVIDLARNFRPTGGGGDAANPWHAGTLEWLPMDYYSVRSIPTVTTREPLWDHPTLPEEVRSGQHYLPNNPTGWRETIVTSPIGARPQYLLQMPGPSWATIAAALFTSAFFLLLTIKWVTPALVCGALAIVAIWVWLWDSDPGPSHLPVDIGNGVTLPVYATGPMSHAWWGVVVLLLVIGTVFVCFLFSYGYLWLVAPQVWPAATGQHLPGAPWPLASGVLLAACSAAVALASRTLAARNKPTWSFGIALGSAAACSVAALVVEVVGHREMGLSPTASSYGAVVYLASALQGTVVATLVLMVLFTVARAVAGRLDAQRRGTFDHTMLFGHYVAAQGIAGLAVVHLAPRLLG